MVRNFIFRRLICQVWKNRCNPNYEVSYDQAPNLIFKLLSYLGYVNFNGTKLTTKNVPRVYKDVCAFPLLAYQKIYFDFFRNTQWEHNRPECYNADY